MRKGAINELLKIEPFGYETVLGDMRQNQKEFKSLIGKIVKFNGHRVIVIDESVPKLENGLWKFRIEAMLLR